MPTQPDHSRSAGLQPPTQVVDEHAHDHVRLDFEKLDCYRVALELNALVPRMVPRGYREVRDQLTRASLSILLNCAESAGRTSPADKARFISIARGSAMECAAIIDVLLSSAITPIGLCREARRLLIRTVQMLTKLEAACRIRAAP
jgi:four helix bundle protein